MFRALHIFAIVAHSSCAIYAFSRPAAYSTSFEVGLRRVDYTGLEGEPYYLDSSKVSFQFPSSIVLHGIVAVVTALFHLLVYLPIHEYHGDVVWRQNHFLSIRWIEYSITCTLMTISSLLSSGTVDFNLVVLVVFAGMALQFMGCCVEQFKHIDIYAGFLVVGVMIDFGISWAILWGYLSASSIGSHWLEAIVYVFYYSLFGINCLTDAVFRRGCFIQTDWYYNVLSVTSKVSLFWLQVGEVERNVDGGIWPELQIFLLGTAMPLVFLIAGLSLRPVCPSSVQTKDRNTFYGRLASLQLGVKKKEPRIRPRTRDDVRRKR